jgi:dTDP-4-amino-4,6-dideoxygalactose transaminase
MVEQFESDVAGYVGAKQAIATSNCTTAMHIAWLIHGIGPGCEVICPSYSFIASANAIRHAGAEPVFADIDAATLNLDPQAVEAVIQANYDKNMHNKSSGRTLKAILAVHQIGIPCDLDALSEIANKYGLLLLEDAACALGSSYKQTKIGGSGNTCAFSFHPRKVITTGEGGMLTLSDGELNQKARIYRAHGMSVSDLDRHRGNHSVSESYDIVGYNYRMTDIQASLGIKQMEILDASIEKRKAIAQQYNDAFLQMKDVQTLSSLPDYVSAWNFQSYPIRIEGIDADSRQAIMTKLQKQGISTKRGIPPIHLEPAYGSKIKLPVTEAVSAESIFIPIYAQMTPDDVAYVIENVITAYNSVCKA